MSRTLTPPPVDLPALPGMPGASLPTPESVSVEEPGTDLLAKVDDAVAHALAQDARGYFEAMKKQKPELFYKWAALVISAKTKAAENPGRVGKTYSVLSPLAPSPLDAPPP